MLYLLLESTNTNTGDDILTLCIQLAVAVVALLLIIWFIRGAEQKKLDSKRHFKLCLKEIIKEALNEHDEERNGSSFDIEKNEDQK